MHPKANKPVRRGVSPATTLQGAGPLQEARAEATRQAAAQALAGTRSLGMMPDPSEKSYPANNETTRNVVTGPEDGYMEGSTFEAFLGSGGTE